MKKSLSLLIFALALPLARASEPAPPKTTVAVYDFTDTDKGEGIYSSKVTALVTAELAEATNLVLLERAELDKALKEQAFGVSGLVSSDAAAKIGQITGAKVLVAGQVMKVRDNHLVIIANIIGTETGRLFAEKVEGDTSRITDLTSDLARKIAQTISAQSADLIAPAAESNAELLERIVKSVTGTNRPSVSVNITWPNRRGPSSTAEAEFGRILLKAGFPVVDAKSDRKPDIEITGVNDLSAGPRKGGLFTFRDVIDLKIQERRSGKILSFEHQEGLATDATKVGANRTAQVNAVDALAERVLSLLAKNQSE